MLIYPTLLLCAILLALMVYRYDIYDREPWYLLVLTLLLGYAAFSGLGYLEDYSNTRLGFYGPGNHSAGQAAVAASHEELAKLIAVVVIAIVFRRHFNDPMDGLVYGAFAGLGMAIEESLFYVQLSASLALHETTLDIIGREVTRLVLHILMGGIAGFGVGLAVERSRIRLWFVALVGWLAISMSIHFLWDYLCGIPSSPITGGDPLYNELMQRAAAVLLMLTAMGVFGFSIVLGPRLSRERFSPGNAKRFWGWALLK